MANLKTDSPLSHRIVRAFFDFLDSVELAPGVDPEGLDVAKECLARVFELDLHAVDDTIEPGLLINLFRGLEANGNQQVELGSSSRLSTVDVGSSGYSNDIKGDDWTRVSSEAGLSKDELFGQFFSALEKIQFFRTMPDGSDDPIQLERATHLFHDTINEMEKSGCQSYTRDTLADTLKTLGIGVLHFNRLSLGNRAMQSKLYTDAIELYSCAISLSEHNAVYYCNRAAAYTQIHKCNDAIRDCLKSIEINPNYSKAYSRLGLAYYAQGKYQDAIEKGFKKALLLDPDNDSVKENIRVAEQKLKEESQRTGDQPTTSSSHGNQESNNHSAGIPPPFSMPFNVNVNSIPVDLSAMFNNMASNMNNMASNMDNMAGNMHNMGGQSQDREGGGNTDGSSEPGARVGGNFQFSVGEAMPAELEGALRSVMSMFTGAAPPPQGNPHDTRNERSPPN